ncbi:MAG TPA: UbiX family flavin prenyltransferase [Candidatus Eremiobacteraeota bacterium]|mgnify:CR=1 FL=1|nr:MAG: putative aromatic acid decarboxylase [bacterium ADurb.Bin363]HPZ09596.1 UbiX family flavin prenyltransferase [Candidatus Eremiobacteraeota bacterium]
MIILGITGASGVIYGKRICEELVRYKKDVGLIVTEHAKDVLCHELKLKYYSKDEIFSSEIGNKIKEFSISDMKAPLASGSFKTEGMVIAPSSINSLASIAGGICNNLLLRSAQVTLKERRKLILVPRESPLGTIQLRNLLTLSEAGALIVPPCPAFYYNPETIEDIINFTVSRVLNLLGIENNLITPWGEKI